MASAPGFCQNPGATSITINQPGGVLTYKITPFTEITFKGQTTTVDQLQAGMRVQVIPDAADAATAGEILSTVGNPRQIQFALKLIF